jgi:hypothetical protein
VSYWGPTTRPSELFHGNGWISFAPDEGPLSVLADYIGPHEIPWRPCPVRGIRDPASSRSVLHPRTITDISARSSAASRLAGRLLSTRPADRGNK